jgi:hypothetical protein
MPLRPRNSFPILALGLGSGFGFSHAEVRTTPLMSKSTLIKNHFGSIFLSMPFTNPSGNFLGHLTIHQVKTFIMFWVQI